ncbi:response regulator [Anabaena sphaerica FACHB-251]|uniref:Response regulator n=1 Tax=Anabaena sphaerica FACHB-251 TaxID=2692883 RepID=A0A926ZZN6_9NOST|nr:response regulator [Anabaena sphaerica]MBD2292611.1 response regulator [Anabaena sphaerica FACHB-251]
MMNKNLDNRKIVIADDDDDSREMLAFLLEQEGWEVKEAKDGKEALEIVVKYQPNLLILDNRMPELTGVEVFQQLQLEGISLAVIFATAYGYSEELASSLGISHWVTKPYDIPQLLETIESAWENSVTSM